MMLLKNGDYVPDGNGGFATVSDKEALLGRVLFRLTARRGKFPFLPELGSRLYQLLREKPAARETLAAQYAAEALAAEEELTLVEARWEEGAGRLTLLLDWKGETVTAAVTL